MRRLALAVALALALGGCGGGETAAPEPETVEGENPVATQTQPTAEGDAENGKKIYAAQGCGSCHTLADAGSTGTVGPNLDEAKPDMALAIERITNGRTPMPAFKDTLGEQEIVDVATYVVQASGGG